MGYVRVMFIDITSKIIDGKKLWCMEPLYQFQELVTQLSSITIKWLFLEEEIKTIIGLMIFGCLI
jgi:hypothetical protein